MNAVNYTVYKLSLKEYIIYGILGSSAALIISYLFYQSFIPFFASLFLAIPYFKQVSAILKDRRNEKLCIQFKDSIVSISTSLESGQSIENAIWDAYLEVSVIHSKSCCMAAELLSIYNMLKVSIPIEEAFSHLAARTDVEDIKTFCDILKIAKRSDGNIISIIKSTAGAIEEKAAINREIRTNINGKKFEQLIMSVTPVFIILYVKLSSPDFFDPLYHNAFGIFFVTICLIVYAISVLLALKITRIEV